MLQSDGFTLVEVLVSLGIFAMLTGVVLSNYRGYNTNALFANSSEDIVLALRQAQVYGVGVKGAGTSFNVPYGVYFNTVNPNQVIIFADRGMTPDGKYVAVDDNPIIETINWVDVVTSSSIKCGGFTCGGTELSITFKRPNPDAMIRDGSGATFTNAEISITKGTKTSKVYISSAGQISLQ